MTAKKYVFHADRLDIKTRKTDNAIIITIETGEFQKLEVAKLLELLGLDVALKVTIEISDE